MKLSVPIYRAYGIGRGASLDTIDNPLNNRRHLLQQFDLIRAITDESTRVTRLMVLVNWNHVRDKDGEYYDDMGHVDHQPHLVMTSLTPDDDPQFVTAPLATAFQEPFNVSTVPIYPITWYTSACAMYDASLSVAYPSLRTSSATYTLRVVYGYDSLDSPSSDCQLRLIANNRTLIADYTPKPWPPQPISYTLPQSTTATGALLLTWNARSGSGGSGRCTQLAEVWLTWN